MELRGTELGGKVALVTGGGRGIGRGIVDRFLEEGAQVAVVQRRPLDGVLAGDARVAHVKADLGVASSAATAVEHTVERFGGVDILVNNAGIMFERAVSEIRADEWDLMVAVNLRAPLFLAQAVLPHMRRRGGGSIINIGSIEGLGANPGHAAYCASKAGVHGMTRAMAVDLGVDNIRCNAIAPGWITSELSETYLESQADPAAVRDALARLHPVGRVGRPTDVGDLAVYLAGDRSSFLTGEIVVLDGGRTAKLPTPLHTLGDTP
ncbi:MAG: glucose 1-dehydrogenase [Pseudonocardia sp.]|nr:glucose 1-dehydrogenase [Pseudonocardia sp.]